MKRWWPTAAVVAAAAVVAYRKVVGPWHESWGATDGEVNMNLPGDELVAEPATQTTRGITIEAPRQDVWPWVIQLGADRGGFYTYDWLENLFGLGIHSADEVVPDWQQRAIGDLVYANATGSGGWYIMDVRPNEALVLKVANIDASRPVRRDELLKWEFLWTFAVKDEGEGTTRLLVRERVGFGSKVTRVLMAPVGFVSFVMTQKMMRGIKARARGRHLTSGRDAPACRARSVARSRVSGHDRYGFPQVKPTSGQKPPGGEAVAVTRPGIVALACASSWPWAESSFSRRSSSR